MMLGRCAPRAVTPLVVAHFLNNHLGTVWLTPE
jgi:hypothetical protein